MAIEMNDVVWITGLLPLAQHHLHARQSGRTAEIHTYTGAWLAWILPQNHWGDVRPGDPVLLHQAAEKAQSQALQIALEAEAFRLATVADPRQADLPRTASFAASLMNRLLDAGLLDRAVALYRRLPPALRACINEPAAPCWPKAGEVRIETAGVWGIDHRWDLAAAALLAKDRETALRLVQIAKKAPPSEASSRDDPTRKGAAALDDLFRLALAPQAAQGADPFGILTKSLEINDVEWTPARYLLNAREAERAGYPAISAYSLGKAAESLAEHPFYTPELEVPARVQAVKNVIAAERAALAESLLPKSTAATHAKPAPGPSAALAQLSRFNPLDLQLVVFDRARRHGFVIWATGDQEGGTLRLEEKKGIWKVEEIGSWVS